MSGTTSNIKAVGNGKGALTINIQARDCHVSKSRKTMIVGKVTRPTEIMNSDGSGSGVFYSLTLFRYPRPNERFPEPTAEELAANADPTIGANIPSEVKANA